MEPMLIAALGAALALGLVWVRRRFLSFPAQRPGDYSGRGPEFDLRTQLNGHIRCDGVIYGPAGRVTSRFAGDFFAEWQGDKGVMSERFTYETGAVQNRCWTLKLTADGRIEATAPDVIGVARGAQCGPAVRLRYKLRLPETAGGHVLDVVDWMYLAPGGVIVNRSQFRKFGIQVAELVATMRPAAADSALRDAA